MNSFYCWSNAKFIRWRFDLMFFTNATSQLMQSYSRGTRELLYTLVSSKVSRSEYTWDIWTFRFSLCEAVKFRHGENFFLQIFIGFSWLCGTSFDVMMTVCWMLWRFYLFWSSLLCLWLCWQISVSFCWCQHETSVFKTSRWAGWLEPILAVVDITTLVNISSCYLNITFRIVGSRMREALMVQEQLISTQT